ncbi:MAG: Rpn family recombination-promoting nuclease/putative transposase, partial [Planctomycetaceae bacterium]|nr:Rpn family recombination-promoting nuclease/putative transposase [Planctomycetaceae bacterium]
MRMTKVAVVIHGKNGESIIKLIDIGVDELKHTIDLLFRGILCYVDLACSFLESHVDEKYTSQLDFSQMENCSPSNINANLTEQIPDLLFLTKCKPTPENPTGRLMNVSFICEHQSTPDFDMCLRSHESVLRNFRKYRADIVAKHKREFEKKYKDDPNFKNIKFKMTRDIKFPYPFVIIVYNGKRKWRYKRLVEMIDIPAGYDKNILHVVTIFINISELSEEELNRGVPAVRALKWALRYTAEGTLAQNYGHILEILQEDTDDPRSKDISTQFITYITSNIMKEEVSEEDVAGLRVNIERHCVKITNNNPKEVKKMISILDGAVKIGEKRGEERGKELGIRIGEER